MNNFYSNSFINIHKNYEKLTDRILQNSHPEFREIKFRRSNTISRRFREIGEP